MPRPAPRVRPKKPRVLCKGNPKMAAMSATRAADELPLEIRRLEVAPGVTLPLPMHGSSPAWAHVLRQTGRPTEVLVLDFETYFSSAYSLKKLSTIEYIRDPRFEVLGLAYLRIPEGLPFHPVVPSWAHGETAVRDRIAYWQAQYGEHFEKVTVVMQNARFDAGVFAYHYGVTFKHVVDTKGLSLHWNARKRAGLKVLAEDLGLPPKGDTADFKDVSNKARPKPTSKKTGGPPERIPPMDDATRLALMQYACHDVWLEWYVFAMLLPRLSNPAVELDLMQHTLDLYTRPTLAVDAAKAEALKTGMQLEMNRTLEKAGLSRNQAGGETEFEAILAKALEDVGDRNWKQKYTKAAKNKKGWKFAIAKEDTERVQLEKHEHERIRDIMAARFAVKSWPLHIARVDRIVAQAAANHGMLPVPLLYCGAHTGRWAGDEKINLQNLGGRSPHALINEVRELLIAPPGKRLVIGDLSAIEARGTAWIAGQEDMLEMFANGVEIYCHYAGLMAGRKLRKHSAADPPPVAAYLKRMRAMGKVQVLGCGYGMGANRCIEFAANTYQIDLTPEQADTLVQTYRESVPNIVKFWYDIEAAFVHVAKYEEPLQLARGLTLYPLGEEGVKIRLPSGRELKYHKVRIKPDAFGKPAIRVWNDKEHSWTYIWGGYLTENIVQAICRDLLASCMLDLERAGWHTALHVHDELVLVTDEDRADAGLEAMMTAMKRTPEWAAGFPMSAGGLVSDRYGEH